MQTSGTSPSEQDRWNQTVISVITVISWQQNRPADRFLPFLGRRDACIAIQFASSEVRYIQSGKGLWVIIEDAIDYTDYGLLILLMKRIALLKGRGHSCFASWVIVCFCPP